MIVAFALLAGPAAPLEIDWDAPADCPGADELLVSHHTATAGVRVVNAGREPFVAYLLSGPDLHPEAAALGGIW